MPLLKLETTVAVPQQKQGEVLTRLSKLVASTIGKPEQYVMVSITQAGMSMSGRPDNAAFADIRSIGGLNEEVNQKLSQDVCKVLNDLLGITPDRVYLNFTDVKASNWGWNSSTFG